MRRSTAVATLLPLILGACLRTTPSRNPSADRDAIAAATRAYALALEIGVPDSVLHWWVEDPVYINTGFPTIKGRTALDSVFRLVHSAWHDVKATIVTDEISVSGDLAYQIGSYSESFRLSAGATQQLQGRTLTSAVPDTVRGRFLFVWRRQPDGSWRIARAIGTDQPRS